MEERVEHSGDSLNDVCNAVEAGTSGAYHCCVNALNNKMRCEQTFLLNSAVGSAFNIDTGTDGVCDRRATGTPPVSNACSD